MQSVFYDIVGTTLSRVSKLPGRNVQQGEGGRQLLDAGGWEGGQHCAAKGTQIDRITDSRSMVYLYGLSVWSVLLQAFARQTWTDDSVALLPLFFADYETILNPLFGTSCGKIGEENVDCYSINHRSDEAAINRWAFRGSA